MVDLDELYARIPPTYGCNRCGECCGHVAISKTEVERIPQKIRDDSPYKRLTCRFVLPCGDCGIYGYRPFLCRLFGADADTEITDGHGVRCDNRLSKEETARLLKLYTDAFEDEMYIT